MDFLFFFSATPLLLLALSKYTYFWCSSFFSFTPSFFGFGWNGIFFFWLLFCFVLFWFFNLWTVDKTYRLDYTCFMRQLWHLFTHFLCTVFSLLSLQRWFGLLSAPWILWYFILFSSFLFFSFLIRLANITTIWIYTEFSVCPFHSQARNAMVQGIRKKYDQFQFSRNFWWQMILFILICATFRYPFVAIDDGGFFFFFRSFFLFISLYASLISLFLSLSLSLVSCDLLWWWWWGARWMVVAVSNSKSLYLGVESLSAVCQHAQIDNILYMSVLSAKQILLAKYIIISLCACVCVSFLFTCLVSFWFHRIKSSHRAMAFRCAVYFETRVLWTSSVLIISVNIMRNTICFILFRRFILSMNTN